MGIRRLLSQWTTKTLGGSTKLSVDDYHLIQDRVHIQEGNLDAIHLTNAVGQATNTQSQSGPIPGTMKLHNADYDGTGNNFIDIAENPGEVWMLNSLSMAEQGTGTATITFAIYEPASGDQSVFAIGSTTSQEQVAIDTLTPIYFGYGFQMNALVNNTGGTSVHIDFTAIRVR